MGPTASGKTEAARALCELYPMMIIVVDSAQVYRGLDVGTAKPPAALRERVPHALLDIRDPGEPFSAADFAREAWEAVEAAWASGRLPLLVGGTGLYFRAFEQGLSRMPEADPTVRAKLRAWAHRCGDRALYQWLARVDPIAAQRIHPHDRQRLLRALEVFELTGRPISALQVEGKRSKASYPILKIALSTDKDQLHQRIEARFHTMLANGLIEEVRILRERGLDPDLPALRSVGYRQVWEYLAGERDWESMVEASIVATRRLAKRQLSWLRQESGLHWIDSTDRASLLERVEHFLISEG